jgi:hypothetical protein
MLMMMNNMMMMMMGSCNFLGGIFTNACIGGSL